MTEIGWTRLLFLLWSWISKWTTDIPLVLRSFPGLLHEPKYPLAPHLSRSLPFSLFLSNSTAKNFSSVDPGNLSQPGEPSKTLPNILPPSYYPTSKIEFVFQKEPPCRNIDIPPQAILTPVIQLSFLHWESLTTSCEVWYSLIKFGLRNQIHFKHILRSSLSILSFPHSRPQKEDEVCLIHWGGGQVVLCMGGLGKYVCDSSCLSSFASENWSKKGWQWARVQAFWEPNPIFIWELIIDSYTPNCEGQSTLSYKIDSSKHL